MSEYKWKATDGTGYVFIYETQPTWSDSDDKWYSEDEVYLLIHHIPDVIDWKNTLMYCELGFDKETGNPLGKFKHISRLTIETDEGTTIQQALQSTKTTQTNIVQTIKELIGDYPFTIEYDNSSGSRVYVKLCDRITFTVKDDVELNELLPALKQACKYLGTL